jgi:hypothetical protein
MGQGKDGALDMNLIGLPGYAPEVPSYVLQRAGVIRLSLQDESIPDTVSNPANEEQSFMRGGKITTLSNGDKSVRVRLDFADGSVTNTEMVFRKAEADATTAEQPEVAGRIGQKSDKRLAA